MFRKLKEIRQKIDANKQAEIQRAKLKKLKDLMDPPPRPKPAKKTVIKR